MEEITSDEFNYQLQSEGKAFGNIYQIRDTAPHLFKLQSYIQHL